MQAIAAVSNGRSTLAFLTAKPVEYTPLPDDFQPPSRRGALPELIAQAEEACREADQSCAVDLTTNLDVLTAQNIGSPRACN